MEKKVKRRGLQGGICWCRLEEDTYKNNFRTSLEYNFAELKTLFEEQAEAIQVYDVLFGATQGDLSAFIVKKRDQGVMRLRWHGTYNLGILKNEEARKGAREEQFRICYIWWYQDVNTLQE